MKKILYLILCLFLLAAGTSFGQSFKVIVNNSNNVNTLSKKEISDLFLKKKAKWSDGTAVMPVDLSSGSLVRASFSQDILGKNVSAIRNFWQQAAFSGTASAPPEKNNDAEVVEYVKKNPGAIGYVSESANISGTKSITIN